MSHPVKYWIILYRLWNQRRFSDPLDGSRYGLGIKLIYSDAEVRRQYRFWIIKKVVRASSIGKRSIGIWYSTMNGRVQYQIRVVIIAISLETMTEQETLDHVGRALDRKHVQKTRAKTRWLWSEIYQGETNIGWETGVRIRVALKAWEERFAVNRTCINTISGWLICL